MKHPMQPIEIVDNIARFNINRIVRFLLDTSRYDLNRLSILGFPEDDWNQFMQLIGYSVSGFGDLSYADPETVEAADAMADELKGEVQS